MATPTFGRAKCKKKPKTNGWLVTKATSKSPASTAASWKNQLQYPGLNQQKAVTMYIITQYVECKYLALKCQDLELNHASKYPFYSAEKSGQVSSVTL